MKSNWKLCRRSSTRLCVNCFLEAVQAQLLSIFWQLFLEVVQMQLSPIFWQLFPEAVQSQLSPIFRQLFSGSCAGDALTDFLPAVF